MTNRSAVPQLFRAISRNTTTKPTKPFRCSPSLEGNTERWNGASRYGYEY